MSKGKVETFVNRATPCIVVRLNDIHGRFQGRVDLDEEGTMEAIRILIQSLDAFKRAKVELQNEALSNMIERRATVQKELAELSEKIDQTSIAAKEDTASLDKFRESLSLMPLNFYKLDEV